MAALAASEGPPKVLKRSPCGAWRVLKWPFGRPKWSSIGLAGQFGGTNGVQVALGGQFEAPNGAKRCPSVSKLAPRGAQEAPSWLQEMAKSAQVEPKTSPRASKLGGKGFQRALRELHGGIRRAVEWQIVKTVNFDDPITLLMVFWCIRRALGRPKWSPSDPWKAV